MGELMRYISLPTIGLMLCLRHWWMSLMAPWRTPWSVKASAGILRLTAVDMRVERRLAPSRREKSECTWRGT